MTLDDIFDSGLTPPQIISLLKRKTISVPAWKGKLENEYYPRNHPVATDPDYHDKFRKGKRERVSKITLGWQRLACKRMSGLMFGIPCKRNYKPTTEDEKKASQLMEAIYTKNRIDALNLKRSKDLFASCESVTIWFAQFTPTYYAGEKSPLKLRCRTFSPMQGDELYPLFDDYDDMIALSVYHTRNEIVNGRSARVSYFDCYTADKHYCWRYEGSNPVEELSEDVKIGKISGVYIHRSEPIWEDSSENVYEAEWTYSRTGNYVRKNSRPTFVIYSDYGIKKGQENTDDNAGRSIIRLGKDDKAGYATWQQANDSVKFHVSEIKRNYFSQLQLPDMSMDNMKDTPMSGESRKMLFIDCQMKVTDEKGIWLEMLDREFNVIREYAKIMFPRYASAFDSLAVEMEITPYQIHDERDTVETLGTAVNTGISSKRTAIRRLGWVDDTDEEISQMESEGSAELFEPTI